MLTQSATLRSSPTRTCSEADCCAANLLVAASEISTCKWLLPGSCKGLAPLPGCKALARVLARPLRGPLQGCKALARPRIGMGWRWGEPHGNSGDNTNLLSHRFCCQLIPLLDANSIASFSSHCNSLETFDLRNALSTQRIYDTTFAQRIYDTIWIYRDAPKLPRLHLP